MKNDFFKSKKVYLVRTVTMYYVGEFVKLEGDYLIFTKCSWIADTGRFSDAVKTASFNEVEPYPEESLVAVNRQAMLDAVEIQCKLPLSQK